MRLFKFRRDPTDPVERVDRFWHGRRLRLIAGLSVADDFSSIRGVVVRAQGEGKYLRLEPLASANSPLRHELAAGCRAFSVAGGNTTEFEALKNDLATSQAELLNRLRNACGSAAESLLAVCVADPGLWACDFDGKPLYASFCNPELLSALSGVSVIDALPAKDLVAGGHGWPLTPLACWLVAADRSAPLATYARLLIHVDHDAEVFYLPVSDGLDDEYPPIRYGRVTEIRAADVESKAEHWKGQQLEVVVATCVADPNLPLQIFLAGEDRCHPQLRELLQRLFPSAPIETVEALGIAPDNLSAVLVAALGAMHVDQMPANLPWLTGGETPRILGRLTPGSPKQWRMLLREMADYHPAAMRLRDAV